jgi:hypothetical protein
MRRLEQRTVPAGNVSGGKKLGAPVPLFPKDCAELPGESGTTLDNASATGTNRNLLVMQVPQHAVLNPAWVRCPL